MESCCVFPASRSIKEGNETARQILIHKISVESQSSQDSGDYISFIYVFLTYRESNKLFDLPPFYRVGWLSLRRRSFHILFLCKVLLFTYLTQHHSTIQNGWIKARKFFYFHACRFRTKDRGFETVKKQLVLSSMEIHHSLLVSPPEFMHKCFKFLLSAKSRALGLNTRHKSQPASSWRYLVWPRFLEGFEYGFKG